MRSRWITAAWLAAAALLLAACGDSADESGAADETDERSSEGEQGDGDGDAEGSDSGEDVTLTFWHYWDANNGEVMQSLVDDWNDEHPEAQVESVFVGFDDLLPKLQAAASGGEAPDIAAGDLTWLPKLTESGRLAPLDDLLPEGKLDEFFPEMLEVGQHDGSTYSVPVSSNNLQLFYNRELFEEAGLDPDAPPETWEELRETASECADPGAGVQGMELFTEPGEGMTWQYQVYLWQAGGEFLTDDGSEAAFDSPEGEEALSLWLDLLHTDESSQLASWGAFEQGSACLRMDGSWMVGIWAADPPFEFGTATMPYPSDGEPATNMGGEQIFMMSEDSGRQEAAAAFIDWVTSHDAQLEWDRETGFMPVLESMADGEFREHIEETEPRALPFVDGAERARSRPPVPDYPEASDAFSREIEPALLGDLSASEALANAAAAVEEQLGSE